MERDGGFLSTRRDCPQDFRLIQGDPVNSSTHWGVCMSCKWWQIAPSAHVENATHGLCIDATLQPYTLRESSHNGCTRYAQGEPAHAQGTGACPPTAEPVR